MTQAVLKLIRSPVWPWSHPILLPQALKYWETGLERYIFFFFIKGNWNVPYHEASLIPLHKPDKSYCIIYFLGHLCTELWWGKLDKIHNVCQSLEPGGKVSGNHSNLVSIVHCLGGIMLFFCTKLKVILLCSLLIFKLQIRHFIPVLAEINLYVQCFKNDENKSWYYVKPETATELFFSLLD